MLTVLDYGGGNLKSVANMLDFFGTDYEITSDPNKILAAKAVLFPGQGHFGNAMQSLEKQGLVKPLKTIIAAGVHFLGICVGMQVLFETSDEAPNVDGLGVFKGSVKRFTQGKIPQIGWNEVKTAGANTLLENGYYYFVNSYHVVPQDPSVISATADYYGTFTAAIERDSVAAMQFHPEKSAACGHAAVLKFIKGAVC